MSGKIVVLDELRELLPPLNAERKAELEELILEEGCRDKLVVWADGDGSYVLVDGHHRFDICMRHGIKFDIEEKKFLDIEEAKAWIERTQIVRRNLSEDDMRIVSGRLYNRLKKKHGGKRGEVSDSKNTAEALSEEIGISPRQIRRNASRAEVIETVESVDGEAAVKARSAPDIDIEKAKSKARQKAKEEGVEDEDEKKRLLADELNRQDQVVIDGACDEVTALVRTKEVSCKVAERFVKNVPGYQQQQKIVSQGVSAVRKAASKSSVSDGKSPEKNSIKESDVVAWLKSASESQKFKMMSRAFASAEDRTRGDMLKEVLKTANDEEKKSVVLWSRKQPAIEGDEFTQKEINVVKRRANSVTTSRSAAMLVNALLGLGLKDIDDAVREHIVGNCKVSDLFPLTIAATKKATGKRNPVSLAFESFWSKYPEMRRKNKAKAFAEFEKAISGLVKQGEVSLTIDGPVFDVGTKEKAFVFLLTRIEEYAASKDGRGKSVPYPERWLKNQRYLETLLSWSDSVEEGESADESLCTKAFESFWNAYPESRRKGKLDAAKAFQTAINKLVGMGSVSNGSFGDVNVSTKEDAYGFLMVQVNRYAGSPESRGDEVPYPERWLSAGRYLDVPESWNSTISKNGDQSGTRRSTVEHTQLSSDLQDRKNKAASERRKRLAQAT